MVLISRAERLPSTQNRIYPGKWTVGIFPAILRNDYHSQTELMPAATWTRVYRLLYREHPWSFSQNIWKILHLWLHYFDHGQRSACRWKRRVQDLPLSPQKLTGTTIVPWQRWPPTHTLRLCAGDMPACVWGSNRTEVIIDPFFLTVLLNLD